MWPRQRKQKPSADPALMPDPDSVVLEMGQADLNECWRLDQQCFSDGEAYDRETIRYLLSHDQSVCYKVIAARSEMIGFVVGMVEPDGTGHVVALGVSPNHRRMGHARGLMSAVEEGFLGARDPIQGERLVHHRLYPREEGGKGPIGRQDRVRVQGSGVEERREEGEAHRNEIRIEEGVQEGVRGNSFPAPSPITNHKSFFAQSSLRPFRYFLNGVPRSLRFRANSTVATRNPSLSPAS